MPDTPAGTEVLTLSEDFPPVSTESWEAAIHADLKGADYEKKLVWRPDEGIAVRPYYRAGDISELVLPRLGTEGQNWQIAHEYVPGPDAVRADELHEAGANAIQELGYALAEGVERGATEFVFAVGSAYFMDIAKLRAARVLWKRAVDRPMRIAARTSRRNKSILDRHTNLLRATTEALAAVIGGCDSLTVEPSGFDAHLAANVQHILREEVHLDAVADPASGSYFIESLTAALASEAWNLYQQVQAQGGYAAAVASGAVKKALAESRAALEKAVASRRRILVGVNHYPNLQEKEGESAVRTGEGNRSLAEPFEEIRERTLHHARETGRYPKVLLLKRGDLTMRMARANFCLNFFGCAGFDIVESEDYAGTDADLIVLCSSDPEYLAFAGEVCPRVATPVIVAGHPKDQIEALQAAGVQGFVHAQSDAVRTLTEWQDRFGMRKSR